MVTSPIASEGSEILSLEAFLSELPEHTEWVNGHLVEKDGMTLKHGRIQSRLSSYWLNYRDRSAQGGEVYTEPPCRTRRQVRRPDVAYLTPELLAQFGDVNVLPQSFPLVAEIISPTDLAEDVFQKANEYLEASAQEVWLVLPDSQWIVVLTQQQRVLFTQGETACTQQVLPGFSIAVNELLA